MNVPLNTTYVGTCDNASVTLNLLLERARLAFRFVQVSIISLAQDLYLRLRSDPRAVLAFAVKLGFTGGIHVNDPNSIL